jgi:hypothetical protein
VQEACPPLNEVGKEAVVENPAYSLSGVYQRLFARCPSLCFPEPWSFVGPSGECRGCVVDPAETVAVLRRAIMDEWLRTDVSYEERVDHLLNGGGRSDPYLLNGSTVSGNGGGNSLKGESGRDWFFGDLMQDDHDWDALTELFLSI